MNKILSFFYEIVFGMIVPKTTWYKKYQIEGDSNLKKVTIYFFQAFLIMKTYLFYI